LTTAAAEVRRPAVVEESVAAKIIRVLGKAPVNFVLIVIALLWLIPTLGLFLTSLFAPTDVNNLGWWEIFSKPSLATFENYQSIWHDQSIRAASSSSFGMPMKKLRKRKIANGSPNAVWKRMRLSLVSKIPRSP
jgi:ABC-type glycerol-3-phosphate transport system permease component